MPSHPDFPLTVALLFAAAGLLLWVAAPDVPRPDREPANLDCGDERHSHVSGEGVVFCLAMRGLR